MTKTTKLYLPIPKSYKEIIKNNTYNLSKTKKHGLNTVSVVQSASTRWCRSHTVTQPATPVPSRVGATQAVLRDTPWPNHRISALDTAHGGFNTVLFCGLTVERRIMPEDLR